MYGLVLEYKLKKLIDVVPRPGTVSWTTADITFNFNDLFKSLVSAMRINNEDGANVLRYRLNGSVNTIELPAGGRDPIATWVEQIEIEPNALTGLGTIQLDLVPIKEAIQ